VRDVLRLVMGQGVRLAIIGCVLGVVAAVGLTRFVASLLYDVGANDPVVFGAAVLLLMAVAALACWLPAWRAAKVDAMVALRSE
jgi:putative ABC transport system permease protein